MIREIGRGEVIGEMSLFTGEPRSATVVAVRDSVLVKLDKPQFDGLLALSPQVSLDADAPDHPAPADPARAPAAAGACDRRRPASLRRRVGERVRQ